MPNMPGVACSMPHCPYAAIAGGRCAMHRLTTTQRGYGRDHQVERREALPGARCEACGCRNNLQRDHRVPTSLGGSQDRRNKRWLCACTEHACHQRIGVRS